MAYNWGAVVSIGGDEAAHHWQLDESVPVGPIHQRGNGAFTLCKQCNNDTGAWYGEAYSSWVHQVAGVLLKSKMKPVLMQPYLMFPLRVLKQIVSIFLSVNPRLRTESPELADFILHRYRRGLPDPYRVAMYYTVDAGSRWVGHAWIAFGSSMRERYFLSDFSFSPVGFLMTRGGEERFRDARLCDISRFGMYGYDDFERVFIRAQVLPTVTSLPGDYRSTKELGQGPQPTLYAYEPDSSSIRRLAERPPGHGTPSRRPNAPRRRRWAR